MGAVNCFFQFMISIINFNKLKNTRQGTTPKMLKTFIILSVVLRNQNYVRGFTNLLTTLARVGNIDTAILAKSNALEHLEGNTLLSVQQCLKAYNAMKGVEGMGDKPNLIFLDASWWHKGDLDGRKMYVTL